MKTISKEKDDKMPKRKKKMKKNDNKGM